MYGVACNRVARALPSYKVKQHSSGCALEGGIFARTIVWLLQKSDEESPEKKVSLDSKSMRSALLIACVCPALIFCPSFSDQAWCHACSGLLVLLRPFCTPLT